MTYDTDIPPTIRRINQTAGDSEDDWVLETASGSEIATYQTVGMTTDVWWEDCLDYIAANASNVQAAVKDITLLLATEGWEIVP